MTRKLIDLAAMLGLVVSLAAPAAAQDSALTVAVGGRSVANATRTVADGNHWLQSSREERKAFIIGASSMMALESAYARKNGTPSPLAGTRAGAALKNMTLDQICSRITGWYEANPGSRDRPVIGVLWRELVESNTASTSP